MHRIDGPGATIDNEFTEGDPVGGVEATTVTDDWLNDVQENICEVIEGVGIALVKGDSQQLKNAIAAMIDESDPLDTTRIDVASAATVNLTTAAPDTRHINITGTATINGFTVAEGMCYFVRFAGALTLTNGASLVTQSGENIATAAGDTCIIRATAANVVEILCYVPAGGWKKSLSASGYQKFPSGLIIQWGSYSQAANGDLHTLPIAFPNAHLLTVANDNSNSLSTYPIGTSAFLAGSFRSYSDNTGPGAFQAISIGW